MELKQNDKPLLLEQQLLLDAEIHGHQLNYPFLMFHRADEVTLTA